MSLTIERPRATRSGALPKDGSHLLKGQSQTHLKLSLNPLNGHLTGGERPVQLNGRQRDVLAALARAYPGVLSKKDLLAHVTGSDCYGASSHMVAMNILRLRETLDRAGLYDLVGSLPGGHGGGGYMLTQPVRVEIDASDEVRLCGEAVSGLVSLLRTHPDQTAASDMLSLLGVAA